ncbi:LLM class flavin-dependent oxidoreductase [Streptomyces sp. NPDC004539]|uniref:LLM class flavin-dependent oxidoreductase n=1 Tax=Streptomyces sp. NPDC004539 TaxID=3154280 RepID=UPI0033AB336A
MIGVVMPRDLAAGDVVAFARRAEELGFGELWVVEDLGYRGGVAQAATALAVTSRLRVGIGLLPAGARNVAFAAMEIASLAQLHPGRVDVSVGHGMPGWMRSAGAWPRSPLTFLGEYITVLKRLLGGESVDHDGEYVRLDGVGLHETAVPEVPPALLAGVRGPRSLALSGQVADGTLLAEPVSPEYAREVLKHVSPTRPHRLVAYNLASVHPDSATALAAVRPALAVVGEPDWRPHVTPLPFYDDLLALRRRATSDEEFTDSLPDEWVRRLAVTGTPEEARATLGELFDAGVDSAVLIPVGEDALEALGAVV